MSRLYADLAHHYHAMYRHIFAYDDEATRLDGLLATGGARRVLEIGCGSGLLGRRLLALGYDYLGLDLSEQLITIARQEVAQDRFVRGDMRQLDLTGPFDAALITGRTLAYALHNHEVLATLAGVHRLLPPGGLLWFDAFDARGIFSDFRTSSHQEITDGETTWRRDNTLRQNLATGWTWDWDARLGVTTPTGTEVFEDSSTLRAFTPDELGLFLQLAGFSVRRMDMEPRVLSVSAIRDAA